MRYDICMISLYSLQPAAGPSQRSIAKLLHREILLFLQLICDVGLVGHLLRTVSPHVITEQRAHEINRVTRTVL